MYLTQSQLLKQKFWTQGKINELLCEPDLLKENPHCQSRPMKCYEVSRVTKAKDSYYKDVIKNGPKKRQRKEPSFDDMPYAIVGTIQF